MILILSNDGDLSCDIVQSWLDHLNYPWKRINAFDLLNKRVDISVNQTGAVDIMIGNEHLNGADFGAVWFRKFGFFRCSEQFKKLLNSRKMEEDQLSNIIKELSCVRDVIISYFKDKNWLTSPYKANLNKFQVLKIAASIGLKIPSTKIINHKDNIGNQENMICKSVFDPIIASWGDSARCMMYTTPITTSDKECLPEKFMPSLIQSEIRKKYEVRVFYLRGKIYPMAIFSQSDEQTKNDFRCYNWDKPNRTVPVKLPDSIVCKLHLLMDNIGLNCGSIDFIIDNEGDYYFLEVNPTGQFGMVDFPCNYNLHKKVAEELIKMDKGI